MSMRRGNVGKGTLKSRYGERGYRRRSVLKVPHLRNFQYVQYFSSKGSLPRNFRNRHETCLKRRAKGTVKHVSGKLVKHIYSASVNKCQRTANENTAGLRSICERAKNEATSKVSKVDTVQNAQHGRDMTEFKPLALVSTVQPQCKKQNVQPT